MKSPLNENLTIVDSFEENLQKKLVLLREILGEGVAVDRIKHFLRTANGNEQVALNFILNELEKEKNFIKEENSAQRIILNQTTDEILSQLSEEVKCPLCLTYFNKPLILNCFHTFCALCLESIVSNENMVQCPLCRETILLDSRGINGLKTNHYLANIVEKLRSSQSTKMCDDCQKKLCSVMCKQCKSFLCQNCNEKKHALPFLKDHNCIPFEECFFTRPTSNSIQKEINTVKWELDWVIPFNVKKELCTDLFYSWIKELWFAPSDLIRNAVVGEFKMVYIPYWLFEVNVFSQYLAVYSDKLMGEMNEVGTFQGKYSHLMVCASNCEESSLLEKIEPWKVSQATSFTLKDAEGAEIRTLTLDDEFCWRTKAKLSAEQLTKENCRKKMKHTTREDNISKLRVDTSFSNRKSRRVFVPIYLTTYVYKEKKYLFMLNGSTAKAFGHRPYSVSKLASLSFTGFGAAVGFLSVGSRLSP